MPELTVLKAIRQILESSPQVRILVLSTQDSDTLVYEVLAAGAMGYLLKSEAARDLVAAVQSLVEGRPFFSAKASHSLLDSSRHSSSARLPEERSRLTAREQQIVRLIANGQTNKEIAASLNISVRTVETHRSRIMEKLGFHSLSALILYAIRTGLKDPSE
jgi:DNA-binding NarL/FixJ family response regulator